MPRLCFLLLLLLRDDGMITTSPAPLCFALLCYDAAARRFDAPAYVAFHFSLMRRRCRFCRRATLIAAAICRYDA